MAKIGEELRIKLKNLPAQPGVYLLKNSKGQVIYIGKAKNLRNRVRTYFRKSSRVDPKTKQLMSRIVDLELLITDNEIESLILEANLVRHHKPRYNVNLKDDKHFPYIKITNEPFPQILIVRRVEKDGASYFGPYTSAGNMRRTFDLLTRLFKIRTCKYPLPASEGKSYDLCLDYQINRCAGPCQGLQSQEDYAGAVESVRLALSGHARQLIERLSEKMQAASDAMEFESAREHRDQIDAIKSTWATQHTDMGEVVDRDIVAVAREDKDAVAVVMQIRDGVLIGRQDFRLSAESEDSDQTILETFITQYYNHQPNLPEDICIPLDLEQIKLL